MLIGYARVSKHDGTQVLDLQVDALHAAGVEPQAIYTDQMPGSITERPGLDSCLKALRSEDTLVVWKLDRLGRNLTHLVNTVDDLTKRRIGLKVLTGQGASIDTTTPSGKLVFGIFAALAEFERELIKERTKAGLVAARARGRTGGRPFALKGAAKDLALAITEQTVEQIAETLGVSPSTIHRARRRQRVQQAALANAQAGQAEAAD